MQKSEKPVTAVYPVLENVGLKPGYNCYLDFCPADLHYILLAKNLLIHSFRQESIVLQISARQIESLLTESVTIAVVGLSPKPERPSHRVAAYLISQGYTVIPVNPGQDEILGRTCYPNLAAIPVKVDIVDIFRKAADVPPIVDQAVAIGAGAVWMQLGIVHDAAAKKAEDGGLVVVMDRCIKVDHSRHLNRRSF